jgi:hypothetical protein
MKMNKYFIASLLLCISGKIYAKIGCMDNSYHLTQPFDSKNYHFVACNCPCEITVIKNRGKCLKCLHFHQASTLHIATPSKSPLPTNNNPDIPTLAQAKRALNLLVSRYVTDKNN